LRPFLLDPVAAVLADVATHGPHTGASIAAAAAAAATSADASAGHGAPSPLASASPYYAALFSDAGALPQKAGRGGPGRRDASAFRHRSGVRGDDGRVRWAEDGPSTFTGPPVPPAFSFPWHVQSPAATTKATAAPPSTMPLPLAVEVMRAAGFFADAARHEIARTHELLAPRLALRQALRTACEVGLGCGHCHRPDALSQAPISVPPLRQA